MAEVDGAPVGYAVVCPPELPIPTNFDDMELRRIYLLHRFQGRRIGAALMDWAIEKTRAQGKRRLLLGVYAGNEQALQFYARRGFQKIGRREFQVGETICEDAILGREILAG